MNSPGPDFLIGGYEPRVSIIFRTRSGISVANACRGTKLNSGRRSSSLAHHRQIPVQWCQRSRCPHQHRSSFTDFGTCLVFNWCVLRRF